MHIQIKKRKLKAELCKGIAAAIGFMFCFAPSTAKILSFGSERKVQLHMLFVFFPLIAIFLDKDKKIVDVMHLRPGRLLTPLRKARYVVEIPEIFVKSEELLPAVGDSVKFIR